MFVSPSVTPWRYVRPTETADPHNPAIRLIEYDRNTGRHLDLFQYYVDLPKANNDTSLTWLLGYKATAEYGIPDISPQSLASVVGNFSDLTSAKFAKYMGRYNVNAMPDFPCNETCHNTVLCGFRNLLDDDFERCLAKVRKITFVASNCLSYYESVVILYFVFIN